MQGEDALTSCPEEQGTQKKVCQYVEKPEGQVEAAVGGRRLDVVVLGTASVK